jgi:hypothetical protein
MTARMARLVILGGLGIAAAVIPATVGGPNRADAQCLATFGSRNDGICLDQPAGPAPGAPSSPSFGVGPTDGGGPGISSSPLFPGQTIEMPLA